MKKLFFLSLLTLSVGASFAQDTVPHRFNNAETEKLANYIKTLENKTLAYRAAHPEDQFVNVAGNSTKENQFPVGPASDSLHHYLALNDQQVIKIARYIKYLEKMDSLNTDYQEMLAAARRKTADSLALVNANNVSKGMEQYQSQIFFNFDSSVLKEESYKALDEAVKVIKENPDLFFIVEGHTDNVGEDAYNLNLSKARAKSVMNYFVSKGVKASRISSEGYGESKPIASNDNPEGQAKNRRVEIKAKKK
jgi:outer membrane protein OmpA-like peptidoglycan-associated protein